MLLLSSPAPNAAMSALLGSLLRGRSPRSPAQDVSRGGDAASPQPPPRSPPRACPDASAPRPARGATPPPRLAATVPGLGHFVAGLAALRSAGYPCAAQALMELMPPDAPDKCVSRDAALWRALRRTPVSNRQPVWPLRALTR